MNFFKSVFSDDMDHSDQAPESENPLPESQNPNPTLPTITTAWTFGSSLMKTLASKSESVIETYRRDLEEFSSGLKKETAVIREVASRAVKDLPTSLEAGAGLAQESLESVGQAIDNLGTTVTEIIVQGKDSILAVDYSDSDTDANDTNVKKQVVRSREDLLSSKPYSRLDAQILTVQCDMNTYLEDPDDLNEYNEWKLGFKLDEKGEEIENLISGNHGVVGEIYKEIVPVRVDEESFWTRYFYRIYKVKKAEAARAKLVKMAISGEEDEELSWDVDEDEYEENAKESFKKSEEEVCEAERGNEIKSKAGVCETERGNETELEVGICEAERGNETELKVDNLEAKTDEKMGSEGKTDKDSDISVVSTQVSHDEDGWDEIEDIGSIEESKDKGLVRSGSPNRAELRKRLTIAEEEDLTWDIEDDDEPLKS